MEIKVYSSFMHSFECGKNASTDIHYYERQYVKAANDHVICINSSDNHSIIGKMFQPEYRIELWAVKSFEERKKQDFINLQMKRQIIHFCDGSSEIVELKNLQLV